MPGQTQITPIILGVQCCLGRASGQGSGASLFGGSIGRRLPTAWRRLAAFGGDGPWATAHPCDMLAIEHLLGAGGYWGVSSIVWWRRAAVARQKNNSTTNLTAGGKQKSASMNDRS